MELIALLEIIHRFTGDNMLKIIPHNRKVHSFQNSPSTKDNQTRNTSFAGM